MKYFYNFLKKNHGMECFQCPVAFPNHNERSYKKRCQSEDIMSSANIWQMLCWEPSYCNSYSNIFFLKAAYKLKFAHYIVENISHPNCTKQKLYALIIFVWGIIAWEPHILRRKKNPKYDQPKIVLTRNCQITIISITFSCLSFTARSISSSFFSMSRRSKAYIRNNNRSISA